MGRVAIGPRKRVFERTRIGVRGWVLDETRPDKATVYVKTRTIARFWGRARYERHCEGEGT